MSTQKIEVPEVIAQEVQEIVEELKKQEGFSLAKISLICARAYGKNKVSRREQVRTRPIGKPDPLDMSAQSLPPIQSLTTEQSQAFHKLQKFVKSSNSIYFRLTGYAGVGKSYLTAHFVKWLEAEDLHYVVAAPTNKALKNIRNLAAEEGIDIDSQSRTVAQLLGQQPVVDEENGEVNFLSTKETSIASYKVIIIDEFSMLSSSSFEEIDKKVVAGRNKVVFVGDGRQLAPVGEATPIVSTHNSIEEEAVLAQVMRYDGQIGKVAEAIRSNPLYEKKFYPFVTTEDRSIVCLSKEDWLGKIPDFLTDGQFKSNPDYFRVLVWRNKTAASINKYVRSLIFPNYAEEPYIVGDRLIAKKPVFRDSIPSARSSSKKKKKSKDWQIVLNNSEECQVIAEPSLSRDKDYQWGYWSVPVLTDDGRKLNLRILTPESQQKQEQLKKNYASLKQWREYYELDKEFDCVPYAYCLTVHKSQGSSIDNTFIYIKDMYGCQDKQRMQYTALTRTKKQAFICN